MKKIFLKTLVGSLVISALIAILFIITDFENDICAQILLTTFIIFPFSITGLCCSTIYEKDKLKTFSLIGIIINIIGCILYTGLIWGFFDACIFFCEDDNLFDIWELLLTSTTLATSFAHISLLLLISSKDKIVKFIQKATIILSSILDIIILDAIWTQLIDDEMWGSPILIIIILVVLGTIVCPILHSITKNQSKTEKVKTITKKCPKCNYELKEEWKFCPNCNNQIIIEEKEKQS